MNLSEQISVFDIFKIGVGLSNSHALAPWRAAERFIGKFYKDDILNKGDNIFINLYGFQLYGQQHLI